MGVGDDQAHPLQPTLYQAAKETEPERVGFRRPNIKTQNLPFSVFTDPDGDHRRHVDHPEVLPHLDRLGIEPDVRVLPFQRPVAEPLHHLVQFPAHAADGALVDAIQTESPNEGIDLPGADAVDVGFLHNGHQGPLGPPARFEQAGEVAAFPQLGNPQGNGTEAGLPVPLPVAVAIGLALGGAFIALRTDWLTDFQFHQRLSQKPQTLTEGIDLGGVLILAQQLQKRTLNLWGIQHTYHGLMMMFSGMWIPLWFYPDWLRAVTDILPFRAVFFTPLAIYVGHTTGSALWLSIGQQTVWAIVLMGLCHITWVRTDRHLVVQGG